MRELLRRDDVSPDKPDTLGRTPLWYASELGYARVVVPLQPLKSTPPSRPKAQEESPPLTAFGYR